MLSEPISSLINEKEKELLVSIELSNESMSKPHTMQKIHENKTGAIWLNEPPSSVTSTGNAEKPILDDVPI
jgi:hypothetical protein